LSNIPFCRDNSYYVNSESQEIIELGTQRYPYKNIGLVFLELLNIRSHSDVQITIYVKENTIINLQKGYNYIANISSVIIESYSGTFSIPGKATLYVKQSVLNMFNIKTQFNLVSNNTLNLIPKLNVPGANPGEISLLQSDDTTMFVWRSNLTLSNLNIQGNISTDSQIRSYFIRTVYLQEKILILKDLYVQLTGYFLRTIDPMSMEMLNIYVDFHAMMGGFWMNINCNYPEAYKYGLLKSKNLTALNAFARIAPFRTPFLVTSGPENIYFDESNIYVSTDTGNNTFTFIKTRMSLPDNPGQDKFTTYYIDLVQGVYRKLLFYYISNEFIQQHKMPYPSIQMFSNLMTEISVINTTFINVTTENGGLMTTRTNLVLIENVMYADCDNFAFATINILDTNSITIRNLTHQNVNGTGSPSERYIRIKLNDGGTADLTSVHFDS